MSVRCKTGHLCKNVEMLAGDVIGLPFNDLDGHLPVIILALETVHLQVYLKVKQAPDISACLPSHADAMSIFTAMHCTGFKATMASIGI